MLSTYNNRILFLFQNWDQFCEIPQDAFNKIFLLFKLGSCFLVCDIKKTLSNIHKNYGKNKGKTEADTQV